MAEADTSLNKIIVLEINTSIDRESPFDTAFNLVQRLDRDFPKCQVEYHGIIEDEARLGQSYAYYCDVVKCDVIMTIGGVRFMSRAIANDATYKSIDRTVNQKICSMVDEQDDLNAMILFAGVRGKTLILNFPCCRATVDRLAAMFQPILAILHQLAVMDNTTVKPVEESPLFDFSQPKNTNRPETYYTTIGVSEAISVTENILNKHRVRGVNYVPTEFTFGFVCAENISANQSIPSTNISIKNGYACFVEDASNERIGVNQNMQPNMSIKLIQNTCYYVEKGGTIGRGADCVLKMRDVDVKTTRKKGRTVIQPKKAPQLHDNIKFVGSDMLKNDLIISSGVLIRHLEISLLTALKREKILIYTKPCVGILSIGNDLRLISDYELNSVHIRNMCMTNIRNILGSHSIICNDFGLIVKNSTNIKEALERAFRNNDILILTVRQYTQDIDYVMSIIKDQYPTDIVFKNVNMLPGEQTTFGTCLFNNKRKYFYFISSNLISALTSCHLVIVPTLIFWSGINNFSFPVITVCLNEDIIMDCKPKYLFGTLMHTVNHNYACVEILKPYEKVYGMPFYNFDLVVEIPRLNEARNILRRGSLVQAFALPKF